MNRMYSPIGGYMQVPDSEVEDMVKKGWFPEGHEKHALTAKPALLQPKAEAEPLAEVPWEEPKELSLEELRVKWQEKHGKKPHHKKSEKTLLAEI